LNFTNAREPDKGGTIDLLLDGTEGQNMRDNITVDAHDRGLINDDPGNDPIASRIRSYEIKSGMLRELAVQKQAHGPQTNPAYTTYATGNEEISGIIPADDILGEGWYLFDSQIHEVPAGQFPNPLDKQKLVEKGQLMALYYPAGD
jgi:hypothetical protein